MPENYWENGLQIFPTITPDTSLRKMMTVRADGSYKWVNNANDPDTVTEDLVWGSNGAIAFGASTTSRASLRITPGVAPTSPIDGDLWTTAAGVFARINGVTIDLTTGGGVGGTMQWETPESLQSYLSTDLNSLGLGFSASGAEINNETGLFRYISFELVIAAQGVARSAGATVEIWTEISLDGTNYPDRAVTDLTSNFLRSFPLDAATTARRLTLLNVALPPYKVKFYLRNGTGQAFAASGNTFKFRRHNEEIV